jgi:hypothetical protein
MSETADTAAGKSATQAAEELHLLELEAGWENLRKGPGDDRASDTDGRLLQARQRAYDAFRARLTAYNARHSPAHAPVALLNSPSRLGAWCRRARDLCARAQGVAGVPCPARLVEKAHLAAARLGVRLGMDTPGRTAPPADINAAAGELGALADWCDGLAAGSGA